jgi:amino acid adenylation domain-containing protein
LAQSQPAAVALVYGNQVLSYAELNRRSNQLAHRLLELGVGPEQRVAMCLERGVERVIGLLAVLKAGGGYVPLDPDYPLERLRYMLQDSRPRLLLTQCELASRLPEDLTTSMLQIDSPDELVAIAAQPTGNPDARALGIDASTLAYVIYTSGSTGQPKGVMNEHGGLLNLACAQIDAFAVKAESRVLQFASCSFDASISEVVMALCSGAALHLAPREDSWPGEPLRRTIQSAGITHLTLPPAALAVMGDPETLAPMSFVIAGDACPATLAHQWARRHVLFNAYGPSEASVCASIHRVTADDEGRLPIGKPMANVQIHLLDAKQNLVPLGAIGEICIGGTGVARGYLDRPALSAERFIADPFTSGGSARLYRSGDLGRWREDGNLEFLGRRDGQVKLRGFRIELGEIENRLLACAGVREAVAVVREDLPGDRRLVAYYCVDAAAASPPSGTELRQLLAAALPEYMVPGALIALPALPLSANGKIDRKLLPAPTHGDAGREVVPPDGPIEQQIAALWCELLGTPQVGRSDNFFELGGHSLLAVQLIARIQEVSGVELTLSRVFQAPTLAAMADELIEAELSQFADTDLALAAAELDALSDDDVERLLARETAVDRPQ